jgi:hypothetical protein
VCVCVCVCVCVYAHTHTHTHTHTTGTSNCRHRVIVQPTRARSLFTTPCSIAHSIFGVQQAVFFWCVAIERVNHRQQPCMTCDVLVRVSRVRVAKGSPCITYACVCIGITLSIHTYIHTHIYVSLSRARSLSTPSLPLSCSLSPESCCRLISLHSVSPYGQNKHVENRTYTHANTYLNP